MNLQGEQKTERRKKKDRTKEEKRQRDRTKEEKRQITKRAHTGLNTGNKVASL